MLALRHDATIFESGTIIHHEDFMEGVAQVQAKKKTNLNYNH